VLLQNATPLLHTFGGNIFLGLVGNFTCSGPGGNTIIGSNAADMLTTGAFNTFLGNQGFGGLSSGSGNIAISTGNIVTLDSITTGSFNFAVNGGVNYTGAESSNVLIINDGVLGESHKMRLGTYGTGNYQQDKCYVDPTLVSNNGRISKTRSVTAASDTMLATDEFLICNRAGAIALALMASPETGRKIYIKDDSGAAAANNITITPAAGNIDGAASLVINTNYGSYSLIYNGTQWNIF
jgi:hypothetical protein